MIVNPYGQRLCAYLRTRLDARTVEILTNSHTRVVQFRVTLRKDLSRPYVATLPAIMRRHGIERIPEL